ncbi:cobalamin biosynthesis protein CobD [Catellatospora sp. IY07-71]|uniref:cobalamin biosynthesis protein n=1 Tax=Catellatospora sp. IY07-71 TaxID=2728827 RepID=UPI001BB456C9|nr:cobalamin biosynthesis protein [Catellatospora sp. IY07-71]BCJ71351.1 cobalamin biosynthesis protein CobD [Catellatospora sp. IY07-71]
MTRGRPDRRAARRADALGLLAGVALDAAFGDPRRLHPVAGFGNFAQVVERYTYADSRRAGAVFTALAVGVPVAAAVLAHRATRHRPVLRTALTAAGTWAVLGGRSLRREGGILAGALERGDLAAARTRLPHLCGRDPSALDEAGLARATVESIAENSSDAEVAPLVWGALAGLPGLVGYRATNTLDAMVGHRSPRYARFGTASARLDDAANLLPSRLTAVLAAATSPLVAGSPRRTARIWRRDGDAHPSPNSGQCESAFAGALGVRLGGENVYFGRSETRPELGDGPRPRARDIRRASTLSAAVGLTAAALAIWVRKGAFPGSRRRDEPRLGAHSVAEGHLLDRGRR